MSNKRYWSLVLAGFLPATSGCSSTMDGRTLNPRTQPERRLLTQTDAVEVRGFQETSPAAPSVGAPTPQSEGSAAPGVPLADLVRRALQESPEVRLGTSVVEQRRSARSAIQSGYGPTLTAGGQVLVYDSPWAMPVVSDDPLNLPNVPADIRANVTQVLQQLVKPLPMRDQVVYGANLTLTQPLTGLYEVYQAQQIAKILERDAEAAQETIKSNLAFAVVVAYLTLLEAESLRSLTTESVRSWAKQEELVMSRTAEGLSGTQLSASLQAGRLEAQVLESTFEEAIVLGRTMLGRLTNLPPDDLKQLAPLSGLPADPIENEQAALARARAARPEYQWADRQRDLGEHAQKLATWQFLPRIAILGRYDHFGNVYAVPSNQFFVGAIGEWELFDWGRRYHTLEQAKAAASGSAHQAEAIRRRIEGEVHEVWAQLQAARDRYRTMRSAHVQAQAVVTAQEALVGEGVTDATPLLVAKRSADRLQTATESTRLSAWRSYARLLLAMGATGEFENVAGAPRWTAPQEQSVDPTATKGAP